MRVGPPPHHVRRNHTTRVPRTFVYLDAEANQSQGKRERVQSFRLAVTAIDRRYHHRPDWAPREFANHYTPESVWKWIDSKTKAKSRVVVVAHNLAYDLRITRALFELPALGWELGAIRLDGGNAWATWKRGNRTIFMCDSMAWVPSALEKLGPMVGLQKSPLPAWVDTDDAWLERCTRDVEILAAVWRQLMEWVERDDLGNWRPTGAGQSWSAFRHRFMTHDLLVHDDPEARDAERRSMYTGRCEAWRHGRIAGGPFTEWDFTTAYAVIGRECALPVRLLRCHHDLDFADWRTLRRRGAVLTDVTVTTDVPCVPTHHDGRVVWPTGTFESTLWENEIELAIAHGATVDVHRAWSYESLPVLRDVMTWILGRVADQTGAVHPLERVVLKHWSRALVGRFGARYPRWSDYGTSEIADTRLSDVIDGDTGERWRMLQLGTKLMKESPPADAPDCLPSVTAWIMAEARVRLWNAAQRAGVDNVAYMDTDSLLTTQAGTQRLTERPIEGLRVKAEYRSLRVMGPRQYVADGRVRAAGVARDAVSLTDGAFESEAWRSLDASLRNGEGDTVRILTRTQRLRGTDRRRDHNADGTTSPRTVAL